jgi:S-adenosylmethionine:tRNA ribosyltransferase-isomerase
MPVPSAIRIIDFNYPLPEEKIAQFPLPSRDGSKLLVCRDGKFCDEKFVNITHHLPANSLLVFNNTRVIHARLLFRKPTGGLVEIFCLEPLTPTCDIQAAFIQQSNSTWKCLVGNLKRWKSGTLLMEFEVDGRTCQLFADRLGDCSDGTFEILFRWNPAEKTFAEILELMGKIPLPPYIDRPSETIDDDRYQTIYALNDGSVAAPTAGLHFTAQIFKDLLSAGIETEHVTLHVGVGTFRPVSAEHINDHIMHHEKIVVSKQVIERLLDNPHRPVFAVGTTSARTLESLYWVGVKLICEGSGTMHPVLQWDPYLLHPETEITVKQSLESLLEYLKANQLEVFSGETQLMIVPGYKYRLISGLITNFHMPQSTLLLLVAALIGDDWRAAYDHALRNGYRFLSYGDSCLFFNNTV